MLRVEQDAFWDSPALVRKLKKREGVPEMGTKPLKALRGYRASNRGSNRGSGALIEALKGLEKNTRGSKRLGALLWCPFPFYKEKTSCSFGKSRNSLEQRKFHEDLRGK